MRELLLASAVLVAVSAAGCGCGDEAVAPTATPTKAATKAPRKPKAVVDEDDGAQNASEVFSTSNKYEEVRFLFMQGRYDFAATQAEALLPLLEAGSRQRMEVHFLAARCFERLGDDAARRRHDEAFRTLLEQIGKGAEHQGKLADGVVMREVVDKSIEMALTAPRGADAVLPDDDYINVRCHRRLKGARRDEALREPLDAGQIVFGLEADAVRDAAAEAQGCPADDVVMQRDPRFGFFFVIVEGAHATAGP